MGKKFTIFGYPVEHSISPKMHKFAIDGFNLEATYSKTLLEDGTKIKDIFLREFDGANVTVPHKEIAYRLCDEVRGVAKEIEAVNTIVNKNGKMVGYNTDGDGFLNSIKDFKDIDTVLILGAGGTAKALATVFKQSGVETTILNRSKERLTPFLKRGFKAFCWEEFLPQKYNLIVNTTSAGLQNSTLPAPEDTILKTLKKVDFLADVIYGKETPFLHMGKRFDIPTIDGSGMLLHQGVLAFNLFYENRFDLGEITKYMKKAFIS